MAKPDADRRVSRRAACSLSDGTYLRTIACAGGATGREGTSKLPTGEGRKQVTVFAACQPYMHERHYPSLPSVTRFGMRSEKTMDVDSLEDREKLAPVTSGRHLPITARSLPCSYHHLHKSMLYHTTYSSSHWGENLHSSHNHFKFASRCVINILATARKCLGPA